MAGGGKVGVVEKKEKTVSSIWDYTNNSIALYQFGCAGLTVIQYA